MIRKEGTGAYRDAKLPRWHYTIVTWVPKKGAFTHNGKNNLKYILWIINYYYPYF